MVRIVDAYIFREAFQLYIIGFGGFLLFLVVNQLFLEGDRLLNPNFPAKEILRLIGLNVPYFMTMAIPIAVLFGTMMTMGRLAKDNEIDALFTNGIHLVRLYMPFMVLSLINVLIVFAVNETLVPKANAVAETIYKKYPYLRDQQETESDPIIVALPNGAFFAASFVDKTSGTAFYSVYDTLTKKGGEEVDAPPSGPQAPPLPGARPSSQPDVQPAPQPPPEMQPGQRPPLKPRKLPPGERGSPGRDKPVEPIRPPDTQPTSVPSQATTISAELAQEDTPPPIEDSPPPPAKQVEPPPPPVRPHEPVPAPGTPAAKAPKPGNIVTAPQPNAIPPTDLNVSAQGSEPAQDLRLFLSANGQIAQETLSVTQPYVYYLSPDGLIDRRVQETTASLRLGIPLREIFTEIKTPEELSREELARQTEVKRQLGANPAKDATDFYLKFSIPFACLFLSLVAMPLALRAPRDERLLGLVITFVLVMSYYTVYYICKLMGYNELLPPLVAAWMQNIIYAGIAVVIFSISRK